MFSTNEIELFKGYTLQMRDKGYTNYLIYEENGSYRDYYYLVYSKDNITASNLYSYTVQPGSVRYKIPNWTEDEQVSVASFSGNVNITSNYNCLTNAEFDSYSVQPELPIEEVQINENLTAFALVALCACFVALCFRMFR